MRDDERRCPASDHEHQHGNRGIDVLRAPHVKGRLGGPSYVAPGGDVLQRDRHVARARRPPQSGGLKRGGLRTPSTMIDFRQSRARPVRAPIRPARLAAALTPTSRVSMRADLPVGQAIADEVRSSQVVDLRGAGLGRVLPADGGSVKMVRQLVQAFRQQARRTRSAEQRRRAAPGSTDMRLELARELIQARGSQSPRRRRPPMVAELGDATSNPRRVRRGFPVSTLTPLRYLSFRSRPSAASPASGSCCVMPSALSPKTHDRRSGSPSYRSPRQAPRCLQPAWHDAALLLRRSIQPSAIPGTCSSSARPNGLPSESLQTAHRAPG